MIIEREYHPDVTLGKMYVDGKFLCYTLEEPWKDNKRQISCIPEGVYKCVPHDGMKFQNVWEVTNVPNRKAILLHSGNTTDDIEGCILLGMQRGTLKGKPAVLRSKEALLKLRSLYLNKEFQLTIIKG